MRSPIWTRLLAGALLAFLSGSARADDGPPDLGLPWSGENTAVSLVLPAAPRDFVTESRGEVTWTYPEASTNAVRDLQRWAPMSWARVTRELGDVSGESVIRIGRSPDEMNALAPTGYPPPGYASGVTYPAFGVILLTLSAPETWERPDLEAVLTHELSHLALHRAVGGRPLPRWFVEGLAIQQAGEYRLPRMQALMEAVFRDGVIPLRALSNDFPARAFEVNAAYAESADMVGFMRRWQDGKPFARMMQALRGGTPFEEAVRKAYGRRLAYLETVWREELYERYRGMPLFIGGGGILSVVAFFAMFLLVKRRREQRQRIERMEPSGRGATAPRHDGAEIATATAIEEGAELIHGPAEIPRRDSAIPTVHHEGRHHTLH